MTDTFISINPVHCRLLWFFILNCPASVPFFSGHKKSRKTCGLTACFTYRIGGSCAIRTHDHGIKTVYQTNWNNVKEHSTIYTVSFNLFRYIWILTQVVWLLRLVLRLEISAVTSVNAGCALNQMTPKARLGGWWVTYWVQLAEFERGLIVKSTQAGLKSAKIAGRNSVGDWRFQTINGWTPRSARQRLRPVTVSPNGSMSAAQRFTTACQFGTVITVKLGWI